MYVGSSLHQMYAARYGRHMPIPSMQICIESVDEVGGCAYGFSCVCTNMIIWAHRAAADDPRSPGRLRNMLFGAGGTPEERVARRKRRGSILDWITGHV